MVAAESVGPAVGRAGKEARTMLFVALLSTRPGNTFQEGVARRLQWDYPEGANVLAEYWLETEAPRVVARSGGIGATCSRSRSSRGLRPSRAWRWLARL